MDKALLRKANVIATKIDSYESLRGLIERLSKEKTGAINPPSFGKTTQENIGDQLDTFSDDMTKDLMIYLKEKIQEKEIELSKL